MPRLPLKTTILLGLIALSGVYLLLRSSLTAPTDNTIIHKKPGAYAYHINTLNMDNNGLPKNTLYAEYMTHYPSENITKMHKLKLEIFHPSQSRTIITAEKGEISDDEIMLLQGKTTLIQKNTNNDQSLKIVTSDVRILLEQKYMETAQETTILNNEITIKSIGMNAYLDTNKLTLLKHIHTTILPTKTWL